MLPVLTHRSEFQRVLIAFFLELRRSSHFRSQKLISMNVDLKLACKQAPGEGGKKSGERSDAHLMRSPSSPDRSRLAPIALDHTRQLALNPTRNLSAG